MEVFKSESLIRVAVLPKKQEKAIEWKPFKKSFWGNTEEGFYCKYFYRYYTKEDLENGKYYDTNFIVEDNKPYYKPYVLLTFVDGAKRYNYFPTYEECVSYAKKMVASNFENKFEIEYK
jgi:hypothetical protein